MDHRRFREVVKEPWGGLAVTAAGVAWEGLEVAHNLSYLAEVLKRLDLKAAGTYLWHPSPLALFAIGLSWTIASIILQRKKRQFPLVERLHLEPAQETSPDISPTVASLIAKLPPGSSVEVKKTHTETIKFVVGQR